MVRLDRNQKIAVAAAVLAVVLLAYLQHTDVINISPSGISIGEGAPTAPAPGNGAPPPPAPPGNGPPPEEEPPTGDSPPEYPQYSRPYCLDFSSVEVFVVPETCPPWTAQLHAAGVDTWCYRLHSYISCRVYDYRNQIINLHNSQMQSAGWQMHDRQSGVVDIPGATPVYWEAQIWRRGNSGYVAFFTFRPATITVPCSGNIGIAHGLWDTLVGLWNAIDWSALV